MKYQYAGRIFDKLFSIEPSVALLTGGYNLDRLVWFITGYISGLAEKDISYTTFMFEFSEFALSQMGISKGRAKGWQYHLGSICCGEKEKVETFYHYIHMFHDEISTLDTIDHYDGFS